MANKKDKLDELFAFKLAENEIKPSAQAWEKLSLAMNHQKKPNNHKKFVWWIIIAVGLLGSVGLTNAMLYQNPKNNQLSKKNINDNKNFDNLNIDKQKMDTENINANNEKIADEKNSIPKNTTENIYQNQKNQPKNDNPDSFENEKNNFNNQTKNVLNQKNKTDNKTDNKNVEKNVNNNNKNNSSENKSNITKNDKIITPSSEEKVDNMEELKIKVDIKISKKTPKRAEAEAGGQEISERPKGLRRIFKGDSLKSKVKDIFKRKNTN
ncbi:MAG: hypothetical protein EAZ85_16310 [Bacteroidetes bacterium]|nr:MAG: hypothetical protein EAZ85_16310 [Bacteroidota bacterium]TAG94960.1 MAG: hypothetical protein EAZ20_00535 [Bacteroidota bacterium]